MLFNVILFKPNIPSLLNLAGYDDVARTIEYGMQQAGHTGQLTVNAFIQGADKYFLFAAHLMPLEWLRQFPLGSISFNLEQFHGNAGMTRDVLSAPMQHILENFQIVEYSSFNLPFWMGLVPKYNPIVMPIPYGGNLVIPDEGHSIKDIDVLFYGSIGASRRLSFLTAAMGKTIVKPKIVLMQNIYGSERDHFIRRSKIVLSATGDRIFPEVRVSYLLANSKAVISDIEEHDLIDPFYRDNLTFATKDEIEQKINVLLANDALRLNYEKACNTLIRSRDIATYLAAIGV